MAAERLILPLRIVMRDPFPGVLITLQRGAPAKAVLVPPVAASAETMTFDFAVEVEGSLEDGRPRFLGPFVQGPPAVRFVYLCVSPTIAQPDSRWQRRAKIPLGEISWTLIEARSGNERIEAQIGGRARDGGPACATVPILPPGWRLVSVR